MDLAKFIDLVATKRLWFPCVKEYEATDPWEGQLPKKHYANAEQVLDSQLTGFLPDAEMRAAIVKHKVQHFEKLHIAVRQSTYVNCWHHNDYESAAMWSQYATKEGIAIKSSVDRLKRCFVPETRRIRISEIRYMDFDTEESDFNRTYLQKRKSFISENELRSFYTEADLFSKYLIEQTPNDVRTRVLKDANSQKIYALPYKRGLSIRIDPETLIEEVLVSPTANRYVLSAVEFILDKCGLKGRERKSPLNDGPK